MSDLQIASLHAFSHSLVRITASSTEKTTNGGCTGGSGTSEVVVKAALNACATLNARLDPYRKEKDQTWQSLVSGIPSDVSLNVEGWFSPQGNPNGEPFQYFVYAACVSEACIFDIFSFAFVTDLNVHVC